MAALEYFQYPYLSDNYGVLIHSSATGETAAVDCGEAKALQEALEANGWKLTHILVTHHHGDHIGGLAELKTQTGCHVIGPTSVNADQSVHDNDQFKFAGVEVNTIHTPGHTKDMINYYLPDEGIVFTGDTLFSLGCGRLFEDTAETMWQSLQKLMQLPPETIVYSSHEYTQANAAFAITIDPDNKNLAARVKQINTLRADSKATVPSTIDEELKTNPFLRAADKSIRNHLNMDRASDAEVFAEIRKRKDNF